MMKDIELLKNFTILYVEDDEETVEVIGSILQEYCKEVFIAYDGQSGLELYKEKNPDLVLADIQMPQMDGIEMCREIKKIDPHKCIALFTAFNEEAYLKSALNIGIAKYILKPLHEEQFFQSLISMSKVIQSDIDRKNMRQMLETQSKIAAMGEMLENIGHQWRQPLSVITTCAGSILLNKEMGISVEEKEIELLNNIIKHSNYLSKTIDDFRDFFTENSLDSEEFDIKDALEKTIRLVQDSFQANFIEIVQNTTSAIICKNQNQVIQAFLNIFNNVRDAFILNDIKDARYFFVDVTIQNNQIVITFKDNAGGIEEKIINKIFEPYFTTKHKSQGSGIGLYMTNQIITQHCKGYIKVKNCEYLYKDVSYKGAEFKIFIPLFKKEKIDE